METLRPEPLKSPLIIENPRSEVIIEGSQNRQFKYDLASRWHLYGGKTLQDCLQPQNGTLDMSFWIHGFGCKGVCDDEGRITQTYFDQVIASMHEESPSQNVAFSYDAPGYNMTPEEDAASMANLDWYGIQYQPVALLHMMKQWAMDIRHAQPQGLEETEVNMTLIGHSMGARALAELFTRTHVHDGKNDYLLHHYLDVFAKVAGVRKINALPVFIAPAFDLHPQAKNILRMLKPLSLTDGVINTVVRGQLNQAGGLNAMYRRLTDMPYEKVSSLIFALKDHFSLKDNEGFLDEFKQNNPHVLLHQGEQLRKRSRTLPLSLATYFHARHIPYLVIANGDDRIVSNEAIYDTFGEPLGEYEPDDIDNLTLSMMHNNLVCLEDVGHTEMLHIPRRVATLLQIAKTSTHVKDEWAKQV